MSDRTHSPIRTYRSRPFTPRGLVASIFLAAAVPAVIWAVSDPVPAALVVVGVRAVRTLVGRRRSEPPSRAFSIPTGRNRPVPTF
jgi:hypothetical protein